MSTPPTRTRSVHIACWVLVLLGGAIQAWIYRFDLSSEDSVSYLDLSDAWKRGDLSHVANGYWGQVYPGIVGAARFLLGQQSPQTEFPLLKAVNFAIYAGALAAFALLLTRLLRYRADLYPEARGDDSTPQTGGWVIIAAAYTLFIWTALRWNGTFADTPDLCVAALTYIAAALILDLHRQPSLGRFAALGVVLGIAYSSKTAMLPVGVAFLGAAWYTARPRRFVAAGVGVAAVLFVLASIPQVVAYSKAADHLSLGEAGRLNYIWYVNPRVADHNWQSASGDPSGPRLPHPVRQISQDPPAFEFTGPIGGTYPPWYDPSYWYDGFRVPFSLKAQARAIYGNARYDYILLAGVMLGWLVLGAVSETGWALARVLRHPLLIPAATGLGVYVVGTDLSTLRSSDLRLIAPFVVLACMAVFSSLSWSATPAAHRVRTALFAGLLLVLAAHFVDPSNRFFPRPSRPEANEQLDVARGLHQVGICAGDTVAHLGLRHYYWARLARVRIVAEVPDAAGFWTSDKSTRDRLLSALRATGVAAIVQRPEVRMPQASSEPGWQQLAGTHCYVYLFRPRPGGCQPE